MKHRRCWITAVAGLFLWLAFLTPGAQAQPCTVSDLDWSGGDEVVGSGCGHNAAGYFTWSTPQPPTCPQQYTFVLRRICPTPQTLIEVNLSDEAYPATPWPYTFAAAGLYKFGVVVIDFGGLPLGDTTWVELPIYHHQQIQPSQEFPEPAGCEYTGRFVIFRWSASEPLRVHHYRLNLHNVTNGQYYHIENIDAGCATTTYDSFAVGNNDIGNWEWSVQACSPCDNRSVDHWLPFRVQQIDAPSMSPVVPSRSCGTRRTGSTGFRLPHSAGLIIAAKSGTMA